MTPQEFATKIRVKYPDGIAADGRLYANIPDEELTQKIIQRYPVYASQVQMPEPQEPKKSLGDRVLGAASAVTNFIGAKGLTELAGSQFAKLGLAATGNMDAANRVSQPSLREVGGSALKTASFLLPYGKVATGITTAARGAGLVKGASALGKIGAGAAGGYAYDVGSDIESGEGAGRPGLATAIGAAIPGGGVAMNVAGRVAKNVGPKLLSYTSDVPEKAFATMLQRRESVASALKTGVTAETALKSTQAAVRQLRTTLSAEWDDATKGIYNEFTGKRWGMGDKAVKLAEKVADDFGIDLPQNMKKMSAKESIDLLKNVNELYSKRAVKESAQGITVRKFKDFLESSTIKTFGGDAGSVAQLYKNYSAKKGVLDAANDIVRAYSTGKPIQQSTALGRLKALFDENKSAYLDAILDLEKATGRDLLGPIVAQQFSAKLPNKLANVSTSGGLQSPKGMVDKAIGLLLLPLSSPRSAGSIARFLNKSKPNDILANTPGDYLLRTKTGQKVEKSVVDSIKNPSLGLSIKDVSGGKPSISPLLQEARKYKSAEEFVRAAERKQFDISSVTTKESNLVFGDLGKVGTVSENTAKRGIKIDFTPRELERTARKIFEEAKSNGESWAKGRKFESVSLEAFQRATGALDKAKGGSIVPTLDGTTKSQLTDLWKKAHGVNNRK